jgi:hypothetical protein
VGNRKGACNTGSALECTILFHGIAAEDLGPQIAQGRGLALGVAASLVRVCLA